MVHVMQQMFIKTKLVTYRVKQFRHEIEVFLRRPQLLFPHNWTFDNGYMHPGEKPGLGIEFDEKLAAKYPYDNFEEEGVSLRKSADVVAQELQNELEERLIVAGVEIMEARLTHLAYATEIASAMLQRQQAAAILAARKIVVDGAVGMAQMAIAQLEKDNTVELDDERKMAMINNLLVTIVADRAAQPVVNTGSLY